MKEGMERRWRR